MSKTKDINALSTYDRGAHSVRITMLVIVTSCMPVAAHELGQYEMLIVSRIERLAKACHSRWLSPNHHVTRQWTPKMLIPSDERQP